MMLRDSTVRAAFPLSHTRKPPHAKETPAAAQLRCGCGGRRGCPHVLDSAPPESVPADGSAGHYRGAALVLATLFYFLGPILCSLGGGLAFAQPERQLAGAGGGLLVGLVLAVAVAQVLTRLRARREHEAHG